MEPTRHPRAGVEVSGLTAALADAVLLLQEPSVDVRLRAAQAPALLLREHAPARQLEPAPAEVALAEVVNEARPTDLLLVLADVLGRDRDLLEPPRRAAAIGVEVEVACEPRMPLHVAVELQRWRALEHHRVRPAFRPAMTALVRWRYAVGRASDPAAKQGNRD
jgi:hypothetical protein